MLELGHFINVREYIYKNSNKQIYKTELFCTHDYNIIRNFLFVGIRNILSWNTSTSWIVDVSLAPKYNYFTPYSLFPKLEHE